MQWNWGQPLDGMIQMAFVVDDLQAAMRRYGDALRIGPWFLAEHFAFEKLSYLGRPAAPDISLSLGFSGGMMIELIQQHCATPSPYLDAQGRPLCGFHHWAVAAAPDAYAARLKALTGQGYPQVLDAVVAVGSRAAYVAAGPALGGMIELIEITPVVEGLFAHIRNSSMAGYPAGTVLPFPGPGPAA
jgi:hypothetical protein